MMFVLFFSFLVVQRLAELMLAKRNEKRMRERGAMEFGQKHYKYIVLLHISFLLSLFVEVSVLHRGLSPAWPMLFASFLAVQALRVWAIASLGLYWNTKILVLPHANIVVKGPYKWMRHPNYTVVILEILIIPLLFQAYVTAAVFSLLNIAVLTVRIREEERALADVTNYSQAFQNISRFTP